MTQIDVEIVKMYEECGMSPREIAVDTQMEETAIKTVLAQYSGKYRKRNEEYALEQFGNPQTPAPQAQYNDLITEDDHRAIVGVMKDLALGAENESVRARMCVYIHEEVIGRNAERVKTAKLPQLSLSVININEKLQKAREAIGKAKKMSTNQIPQGVLIDA